MGRGGRTINLSAQDIDYIGRVVQTEVDHSLARRNPQEYERMVAGVVDTILNRVETGRYGKTVEDVLNEHRAFSKITGPERLNPYGSVVAAPAATAQVQAVVNKHINDRTQGKPSVIGGSLDYANPAASDRKNLDAWVNPMIAAGATKIGRPGMSHFHGLAPGNVAANDFGLATPAGFFPTVDPSVRPWAAPETYTPSPRMDALLDVAFNSPSRSFDVPAGTYAAPYDREIDRSFLAPPSLTPDRPMPTGPMMVDPGGMYTLPSIVQEPSQPPSPPAAPPPASLSLPGLYENVMPGTGDFAMPPDRPMPSGAIQSPPEFSLPEVSPVSPSFRPADIALPNFAPAPTPRPAFEPAVPNVGRRAAIGAVLAGPAGAAIGARRAAEGKPNLARAAFDRIGDRFSGRGFFADLLDFDAPSFSPQGFNGLPDFFGGGPNAPSWSMPTAPGEGFTADWSGVEGKGGGFFSNWF